MTKTYLAVFAKKKPNKSKEMQVQLSGSNAVGRCLFGRKIAKPECYVLTRIMGPWCESVLRQKGKRRTPIAGLRKVQ
jgi:hypothetical protein